MASRCEVLFQAELLLQSKDIAVFHYAIKSYLLTQMISYQFRKSEDSGKRDSLITSITESIPCSWMDGNMVISPTDPVYQLRP